ncbi:MAG: protein of unknown function transrane [Microvirga sp.]|jgi:TctA family transporter|nr:protein of unknown function transrane [Microvirga sp.]
MDAFSNLTDHIGIGLQTALSLSNLIYCFVGVFAGMLIGVIPGIGALAAMSVLFPLTYHMDPVSALIMLAGIYYGGAYGGSTAAILLNLPGTPSSAVACLDGYPMARQGRAGVALFMTTASSFIAGSIGIVVMMVFSPFIASVALSFGPAEYFALMVLGVIAASTVSDGAPAKGIAMVVLGIIFGTVGTDIYTGIPRFNFGMTELFSGLSLVALAMGLFGVAEVIASIGAANFGEVRDISLRSMIPTREDVRRSWLPSLRGTAIGSFFGTLPGTGSLIACYMSYAVERRLADDPSRFGKGAIEGVVAPEAANNAADQTAFIPTMTLGIPGSASMALLLGVLVIHGITPGPRLMVDRPDMFWGLIMSFWIGNLILLILNIPLIGLWVRVLTIPYRYLYPAILVFVCLGVFSVNNSAFDVWLVLAFGALGYAMRILDFPSAPLILGFVLGPLMEENFRRALILSRGDFAIFFNRPISGSLMAVTLLILAWGIWQTIRARRSSLQVA